MKNRKNLRKQLGQGMTEYIIIVALIAVSSIGVYAFFGKTVRTQTAGLAEEMSGKSAQANISAAQQEAGNGDVRCSEEEGLG
ncbi:pilus assembly protein [Burkholderia gladioli]